VLSTVVIAAAFQVAKASPYFGQPLPGLIPALFASGIVSTDAIELNGVFAPDMKEFLFTRMVDGIHTMFHSQLVGGAWSTPRPLMLFPGQARAVAVDMAVSPDGNELFFLGNYQRCPHSRALCTFASRGRTAAALSLHKPGLPPGG
jgi:hypothetical protein